MVGLAAMMGLTSAQASLVEGEPYVEIWTDRGTGGVYRAGDCVDIFIRPAYDCYVIVYEIDTDGYLRLLFPYDSRDDGYVSSGHAYRLGRGGYGRYYVTGPSGVEYIHVLASFRPFRALYWHGSAGYEDYAYDVTWRGFSDYWGCALPARIHGDPYIAMQSINEFICYDALEAGIAFADFTYFYVDERVHYPRYLCYDCHGYHPSFKPYVSVCTGFRISFVQCDPCYTPCSWWWWCTPTRVYCGPRYVCYSNKPCGTYPSCYKWKSRSESYCGTGGHGTSYGDYYRERVRPKSGDSEDVVRIKSEPRSEERSLYSRNESRSPVKHREADAREQAGGRVEIKQVPARVDDSRTRSDSRAVESRAKASATGSKVEKQKSRSSAEEAEPVKASRSSDSKSTRASSSERKSSKVAPKVRTENKGRSPSQRRRVSR
jgi:hypothetical protein